MSRRAGVRLRVGDAGRQERGQALVLLVGLVVLVLMVLALWDTSNWFLGHRALGNLADGAAVAAANDVDTRPGT